MIRLASYWPFVLLALLTACENDPNAPSVAEDPAASVGEAVVQAPTTRRLGVLLLHYGEPGFWTREHFEQRLFTDTDSVSAFYAEASFGALNL
jgi:hypothetical protein